jgi:N12 class adenine-specific DNA methylase
MSEALVAGTRRQIDFAVSIQSNAQTDYVILIAKVNGIEGILEKHLCWLVAQVAAPDLGNRSARPSRSNRH